MTDMMLQDGSPVPLGLNLPEDSSTTLPVFSSSVSQLGEPDIKTLIGDSGYASPMDIFPFEVWKVRQTVNSCCGWACANALGRARVLRGLDPVILSGTFVYGNISRGRDQGAILRDGQQWLVNGGTVPLEMIKRDTHDKRQFSKELYDVAKKYKAVECYATRSKLELFTALALRFQIVAAVHVGRNFMNCDADGNLGADRGAGNHAICLSGARVYKGRLQARLENSWGDWNQRGGGWIEWESHLEQTNQYHEFFAVRSTIDGDNP